MEETKNKHKSSRNTVKAVAQKVACQSTMPMNARDSAWGRVEVRRRTARGNARERALYACTPPSQLDGRYVGGLTRRLRRAGYGPCKACFASLCLLALFVYGSTVRVPLKFAGAYYGELNHYRHVLAQIGGCPQTAVLTGEKSV